MKKVLAILCAACLLVGMTSIVAAANSTVDFETGCPKDFVSFVDFSKWTDESVAGLNAKGDWGAASATVSGDGLMTLTGTNTSYTQYVAAFIGLVEKDEDQVITGNLPGCNAILGVNKKIPMDCFDSGLCFWVDLSQWNMDDKDGNTELRLGFYDADYNEDGTPALKKGGEPILSDVRINKYVPKDYVGWVKVPFCEMTIGNKVNADGMLNMATMETLLIHPNFPGSEGEERTFKLGPIGFYGPRMQDSNIYVPGTDRLTDEAGVLVDFDKVKFDDGINDDFNYEKQGEGTSKVEDGKIHINVLQSSTGWWYQNGLFLKDTDDDGIPLKESLPGCTTKLDKWFDGNSDKAGLAYWVDTTDLVPTDDPFWFDIYVEEYGEKDKDGKPVMLGKKKNKPGITCYHLRGLLPSNYQGWIKVPFSKMTKTAWGDTVQNIDDVDGKFNADNLIKMTFVASIWPSDFDMTADGDLEDANLYIGDVVAWGEGTDKTAADKPAEKPENNPNSGMTAATGIASGVAIAALVAAAAVCFRKKED